MFNLKKRMMLLGCSGLILSLFACNGMDTDSSEELNTKGKGDDLQDKWCPVGGVVGIMQCQADEQCVLLPTSSNCTSDNCPKFKCQKTDPVGELCEVGGYVGLIQCKVDETCVALAVEPNCPTCPKTKCEKSQAEGEDCFIGGIGAITVKCAIDETCVELPQQPNCRDCQAAKCQKTAPVTCSDLTTEKACAAKKNLCRWIPNDFPFPNSLESGICMKRVAQPKGILVLANGQECSAVVDGKKVDGRCNTFCAAGSLGDYGQLGCTGTGFAGPERCCQLAKDEVPAEQTCGLIEGGFVGYLEITCQEGQCVIPEGKTLGTCKSKSSSLVTHNNLLPEKTVANGRECTNGKAKGRCNTFCAAGTLGGYGELGCTGTGFVGPEKCCKAANEPTPDQEVCGEIIGGFVGYLKINCQTGECVVPAGQNLGMCKTVPTQN